MHWSQVHRHPSTAHRRVIALSDDADPDALSATYRDSVLRITIQRRASSQPRRIDIH
ncbi:Hsp20 family protein [Variovorax sp. J31P179]|uniref:Hsp20/alpha crystallin family protein n=1 Tax=Variovorax sp. J31P179 TaxID=3053508 RepID=UPI0025791B8E|nr:Hsp20 family protein [Variovorax sp. J31P179]MDM0085757.1 Hsp20 family protein [Variovorax sp. J31P179]